ncbi:chromatin modification-related protein EAF7-domain-containing protein [Pisolithus sp. B1]|nr:chromatin modification-related protein EAF7-domain-containing protein [Pisolithus sp. B1]
MQVEPESARELLDSVEGEISFFRSVMKARPVGLHKHFHVLAIRNSISADTGRVVPVDCIWEKLKSCYDLDALEAAEFEGYYSNTSNHSGSQAIRSPSPSENLSRHPHFKEEYSLPADETLDSLASLPSSTPAPSPRQSHKTRKPKALKRNKDKVDMAGLVGGDSDSSALTQEESGDEDVVTPRESVLTGTDAGTDYEEDAEQDISSGQSKPTRGRGTKSGRGSTAGRARAASTATARGTKKRKK